MGTGRLPYSVWWLEARSDVPLSQLLKRIVSVSYDHGASGGKQRLFSSVVPAG